MEKNKARQNNLDLTANEPTDFLDLLALGFFIWVLLIVGKIKIPTQSNPNVHFTQVSP